jgi:hypothetical protein
MLSSKGFAGDQVFAEAAATIIPVESISYKVFAVFLR